MLWSFRDNQEQNLDNKLYIHVSWYKIVSEAFSAFFSRYLDIRYLTHQKPNKLTQFTKIQVTRVKPQVTEQTFFLFSATDSCKMKIHTNLVFSANKVVQFETFWRFY